MHNTESEHDEMENVFYAVSQKKFISLLFKRKVTSISV